MANLVFRCLWACLIHLYLPFVHVAFHTLYKTLYWVTAGYRVAASIDHFKITSQLYFCGFRRMTPTHSGFSNFLTLKSTCEELERDWTVAATLVHFPFCFVFLLPFLQQTAASSLSAASGTRTPAPTPASPRTRWGWTRTSPRCLLKTRPRRPVSHTMLIFMFYGKKTQNVTVNSRTI